MGQQFAQQDLPAWDTLRIVEDRNDHLNWMHEHFADETLVAGQESELDLGPGQARGAAYVVPDASARTAPETNPPLLIPGCLDHDSRDLVEPARWRPHPGFDATRRRRHQRQARRRGHSVWHFRCGFGRFRLVEREYGSVSAQSIRAARTFRRESPRHVNQRHLCGE
jgi:hypothetical protein